MSLGLLYPNFNPLRNRGLLLLKTPFFFQLVHKDIICAYVYIPVGKDTGEPFKPTEHVIQIRHLLFLPKAALCVRDVYRERSWHSITEYMMTNLQRFEYVLGEYKKYAATQRKRKIQSSGNQGAGHAGSK